MKTSELNATALTSGLASSVPPMEVDVSSTRFDQIQRVSARQAIRTSAPGQGKNSRAKPKPANRVKINAGRRANVQRLIRGK